MDVKAEIKKKPASSVPARLSLAQRFDELLEEHSVMKTRAFRRDLAKLELRQKAYTGLVEATQRVTNVASQLDIKNLCEYVLEQALHLVQAERGMLVLKKLDEDHEQEFEILAIHQLNEHEDKDDFVLSHSLLSQVIHQAEPIITTNVQSDPRFASKESILLNSIRSVLAVPLLTPNGIIGAFYLDTQVATQVFEKTDLPVISSFAGITASAIELIRSISAHQDLYLGSVQTLVNALEAKDAYTAGHSTRVGLYAKYIMQALGKSQAEIEEALIAGYLHDVGKIGISGSYVDKAGPLTDEEWIEFKKHTLIGEKILSRTKALKPILPAVRWHHEKLNGQGYPDGLKSAEIPFLARVICVTDAFDAMTSDRPYRKALSLEEALAELERCAGSQFDATIVKAFVAILQGGQALFTSLA